MGGKSLTYWLKNANAHLISLFNREKNVFSVHTQIFGIWTKNYVRLAAKTKFTISKKEPVLNAQSINRYFKMESALDVQLGLFCQEKTA